MYEHSQEGISSSFTARYNVSKLIYIERYLATEDAIRREKQIKEYSRAKKLALIMNTNPNWRELETAR